MGSTYSTIIIKGNTLHNMNEMNESLQEYGFFSKDSCIVFNSSRYWIKSGHQPFNSAITWRTAVTSPAIAWPSHCMNDLNTNDDERWLFLHEQWTNDELMLPAIERTVTSLAVPSHSLSSPHRHSPPLRCNPSTRILPTTPLHERQSPIVTTPHHQQRSLSLYTNEGHKPFAIWTEVTSHSISSPTQREERNRRGKESFESIVERKWFESFNTNPSP